MSVYNQTASFVRAGRRLPSLRWSGSRACAPPLATTLPAATAAQPPCGNQWSSRVRMHGARAERVRKQSSKLTCQNRERAAA